MSSAKISSSIQESQWIWPEMVTWDLVNIYALFRREFQLKFIPKRAVFHLTADQSYQLYLNGS